MVKQGGADVEGLLSQIAEGTDPETLGAITLLPYRIEKDTPRGVDGVFGAGVFVQLLEVTPNEWVGPVQSGFGMHVVRVTDVVPGEVASFESVREQVASAWQAQQTEVRRNSYLEALRERYEVTVPTPEEVLN